MKGLKHREKYHIRFSYIQAGTLLGEKKSNELKKHTHAAKLHTHVWRHIRSDIYTSAISHLETCLESVVLCLIPEPVWASLQALREGDQAQAEISLLESKHHSGQNIILYA